MARLFFDTVTLSPLALRYLVNLVGVERLVLGTDAPFDMSDEEPLETVEAIPDLTDGEREAITSRNAQGLMGEEKL